MSHKCITFVLTARSGLGHLRRVTTIAAAIRNTTSDAQLQLLTNAKPDGLGSNEIAVYSQIVLAERADMSRTLRTLESQLAVLDTIEVPGIETCPQRRVLILRETPPDRLDRFTLKEGHYWDRVLVPNPATHWMPNRLREQAKDICATGWIYRPTGIRGDEEPSSGFVVAAGGGGTESTRTALNETIDSLLARLRSRMVQGFRVRQAAGPRTGLAGALHEVDDVFDPGGALNDIFRTADLVISTAGYNSVLELATTDTPTLLIPIPRAIDDQTNRAREWGPRLGFCLTGDNHDMAIHWLQHQLLTRERREPVPLGPSGEYEAARLIMELL